MVKIVWGILAIFLCSLAGIYQSYRLKKRVTLLKESILLTEQIKTYLSYEQTPTKQLLQKLSDEKKLRNLSFLSVCQEEMGEGCSFPQAWRKGLQEGEEGRFLTKEDQKTLMMFSDIIGQSDVITQLKGLDLTKTLLTQLWEEAQKEKTEKEKLYPSLGVIGGIGIAVLLL